MARTLVRWIKRIPKKYRALDWTPAFVHTLARNVSRFAHSRYHLKSVRQALAGRIANLDDAEAYLRRHAAPVQAPVILISQVQRSGGTLLSQFFDGHPQICSYPHELRFDFPAADTWPRLDSRADAKWNFLKLFDVKFARMVRKGFVKGDRSPVRHSFMLMSRLQYSIFKHLMQTARPSNPRDILNHFFTAFFNAWLNYQGDLRRKRWVTVFAPRLAHYDGQLDGFFSDYPDGLLIQILRDPKTWYPSAKNRSQSRFTKDDAEALLEHWCQSSESMLRNRRRFGDKVVIIRFEDLVGHAETTMRTLADRLNIDWDPILLIPTFNTEPMHANSSFAVGGPGLIRAPLDRASMLSPEEREIIERKCADLYRKVLEHAVNPTEAGGGVRHVMGVDR